MLSRLFAAAALGGLLLAGAAPGRADAVKTDTSLSLVPADASFYAAGLRTKEQVDLLLKSAAYKKVESLPLVKMAVAKAMEGLKSDPNSPLKAYEKFVANKDNQALIDVLTEAGSEEIFVYGGKGFDDLMRLAQEVSHAQTVEPLRAMLEGGNPDKAQKRGIVLALQAKRSLLKIPELVIGAKVKDPKKAAAQVTRLEKILGGLEEVVAPLKGRLKRQKVGGGDFLTFDGDGELVPWDDVPWNTIEDKKDEFEDLIKHLKKMTLSVSVGTKGDYVLLSISSSSKTLEDFGGKGKSLAGREELAPLAKYAKERLTGLGYGSAELLKAATGDGNYERLAKDAKELLGKVEQVKEERRKLIAKDIDALVADYNKARPEWGAQVSFSFMTDTGYEGFYHDYTKYKGLDGVKLDLHHHFGGDPIFAAAFGCKCDGSGYKTVVKHLKAFYGHAEAVAMDLMPEEAKDQYEKFTKAVFPVLRRLDENTVKKLIPAMKDGGLGLVLDAKWSSKQWFKEVPGTPKAMPMAELGLLLGVSDAKLFEDAFKTYRTLLNELYEAGRGAAPNADNVPEFKIPAPEREKGKNGVLLYYPIPEELGVDKQVQPVAIIGKSASALAVSKAHAERLMVRTPVKNGGKPLARKGDLVGASVLDWPGLVDVSTPWVEFGVRTALADFKGQKEFEADAVLPQVSAVLAALKSFRGASSATYVEDGKVVTHTEIVIKDLSPEPPPQGGAGKDKD